MIGALCMATFAAVLLAAMASPAALGAGFVLVPLVFVPIYALAALVPQKG